MQLFTGCRVGCRMRRESPEVKREWEMLGPQFPHPLEGDEGASLWGEGAHAQKQQDR